MSAMELGFLAGIGEKLRYYVYALVDPRDGTIFYVGKGKGDRVFQHAAAARAVDGEKPGELKLNRIREIHQGGDAVVVEIIRHGLDEDEAFEVEAAVIDVLRLTGHELTNKARGMFSRAQGHVALEEIRARYAAPPIEITDPVILIRVNKLYRIGMSEDDLYTATREWWKLALWRRPQYAFAVFRGIVRAVYAIDPDGWVRDPESGRWQFSGTRDDAMEARYAWHDVSAYLPDGARYPIRYVNC